MAECAICLQPVRLEDEAFLSPCFHRFHLQCARSWNETQRRHPAADEGPQYRCPMCRQTYTQLIYDCVDRTFQTEALDSTAQAPAGGLPRLQLTAAQRRRRSRYAGPAGQSQVDNGANADSAHRSALAGPSAGPARQQRSALRPRSVSDPVTRTWMQRELQAVLLEDDVKLVLATAEGALMTAKPSTAQGGAVKRTRQGQTKVHTAPSQPIHSDLPTWHSPLTASLTPFLGPRDAQCFASELHGFLQSGLSIDAYDRAVFDTDGTTSTIDSTTTATVTNTPGQVPAPQAHLDTTTLAAGQGSVEQTNTGVNQVLVSEGERISEDMQSSGADSGDGASGSEDEDGQLPLGVGVADVLDRDMA